MACKECSYPLLLDFGLLARQKLLLLELLAEHKGTKYDEIEGIVYMIDAIQDYAVKAEIEAEDVVFPKEVKLCRA